MKDFDLVKAQNGSPVITKDGQKVTIFTYTANCDTPIIGLVHKSYEDVAGKWLDTGYSHEKSVPHLMLGTVKRWAIGYAVSDGTILLPSVYSREEDAITAMAEYGGDIFVVEVTF